MRQILKRFNWQPSRNFAILCLLANIFALSIVLCQDSCTKGPCYPPPKDISEDFNVTANSTCGDLPEQYCDKLDCTKVCDAKDPNNEHKASFVSDPFILGKFWKSKNFEYPVALQFDFGRIFMLYRSVVTFYHELPAAMYLLKSNDSGRTFNPIAYFETNCTEFFNMPETPENKSEGLKVQCFGIDPDTNPNLQLFYSPLRDTAAAQNLLNDTKKQSFFLMTNIKMVLVAFITPSRFDPASVTESLKKNFYFAVSEWDVLASCHCNGQASECDPDDFSKFECERNTAGSNCEKCLPLFNNKPYRIREACEACGCNNQSESCSYNETKGYGDCNDFKGNNVTLEDGCDLCKESFYRNAALPQNGSNACLGCKACECNLAGSKNPVCNKTTGQCRCKEHSRGRQCNTCSPGYGVLSVKNSKGCLKCQCSNKLSSCVSDQTWFVSQITTNLSVFLSNADLDNWAAINSAGIPVGLELDWIVKISIDKGSLKVDTAGSEDVYFVAPDKYLADQRYAYSLGLPFHLQQDNASSPASSSKGDVILQGRWFDQPLVTTLDTPPPSGNNFNKYEVKLNEGNWRVGNTSGRQPSSDEMIRVLSHLTSLRIKAKWTTLTAQQFSRLADIALTLNSSDRTENPSMNCSCPPEYKGQFCEQCASGYTRKIPNGGTYVTSVACQCSGDSGKCHPETGECMDYQHTTTGYRTTRREQPTETGPVSGIKYGK